MSSDPLCPRHEGDVYMRLRSLHTDASQPGQLVGLYECPECGDERRHPFAGDDEEELTLSA